MKQETEFSLLQSLVQLQSLVFSSVDRKDFPVTRTQFVIFIVLAMEGDLTMKHIAQYIASSQEQATRAVAPLADAGYVERYTNRQNRTHVYIRMTESGRRFLAKQQALISERLFQKVSASLSEEETNSLYAASAAMNKLLLKIK